MSSYPVCWFHALLDEGVLVRNGAVKVTKSLSQMKIPPTVRGILASRIDHLPPEAKELGITTFSALPGFRR